MNRQYAFVLKHHNSKLSLLVKDLGKIETLLNLDEKLSSGIHISYYLKDDKNFKIKEIKKEYWPLVQAKSDIYFLHFLIEIFIHFVPINTCDSSLYSYFVDVYKNFSNIDSIFKKRLIACKLFTILGFYPDCETFAQLIINLSNMPIDKIHDCKIDYDIEKKLCNWLNWSIQSHPNGKLMNVSDYLLKE